MTRTHSTIVTTVHRDGMVQEAIASVLSQTRLPNEVIVVVDGGPMSYFEKLKTSFPDVTVIWQPNLGVAIARNTGVAHATSDFVSFLDDDDIWHKERLAVVDDYLEQNPECLAVNHPVWWFCEHEDGPKFAYGFKRDFVASGVDQCHQLVQTLDPSTNSFDYLQITGHSYDSLLVRTAGALSGSTVHRKTLIASGCFNAVQAPVEDWMMFLNIASKTEWHTIPRRLCFCRLHNEQATNNSDNAVYILAALLNRWLAGRATLAMLDYDETRDRLAQFGREYRRLVQDFLWGAIKSRNLANAKIIVQMARLLLPRRLDRLYIWLPPQLTWRWEKYVLGCYR